MSRIWMRPVDEERLLDEVAHRQRALRIARTRVTPQLAAMAETYADAYPWMDPSATQSFLQAGIPADDPRVQQAATLAAEDIQPDNITDGAADSWWETLGDTVLSPVKGFVRGAFTVLAAPFEETQALLSSLGEAAVTSDEDFSDGISIGEMISDLGNFGDDVKRFWDNYTNKAAASGLRLAIGDLLEGKDVDLGEGFLPGSYSESTRGQEGFTGGIYAERERSKHRLELDGTFVTPGRLIARDIVEPGTKAYTFLSGASDFALNIWGDPTVLATAGLSKAAKANQAFQTVGLLPGTRKTVSPQRAVQHYLSSKVGHQFKRWVTETTDPRQIWEATGKVDLGLAKRLASETSESTVHGLLSDALGTVIREKPTARFTSRQIGRVLSGNADYGKIFGGGAVMKRSINRHNVRLFRDMPSNHLPLTDIDEAAVQLEAWMRGAKMGDEAISRALDRVATEVPQHGGTAMLKIAEDVMSEAEGLLVKEWGVRPSRARNVTKMWRNMVNDMRSFQVDDVGREIDALAPLKVHLDGKQMEVSNGMGIVSDLIGVAIPLPDAREIRRLTPAIKRLNKLYDSGLWKGSIDAMDTLMSTAWKPMQLLRFAYTTRVIGEEQLRMAAAGYDSLAGNPMAAIATMMGVEPSSRLAQRIQKAAVDVGDLIGNVTATARRVTAAPPSDSAQEFARFVKTLKGEGFTDELEEFKNAMSRGSAGHRGNPGEILTGKWVKVGYGEENFYRGWAERLAHIHHDPVMRRVAGGLSDADVASIRRVNPDWSPTGNVFDDVAEWFSNGSGRQFRDELAVAIGGDLGNVLKHNRAAADDYLRQNFVAQMERITGGNSDLVELVASGKLGDDISLRNLGNESKLGKRLADAYDDAAPRFIPMEERFAVKSSGLRTMDRIDRGIEYMFGFLMSKPTNYLSRSPAFRQMYWQRVDELIGRADEATQHALIRAAKEANVSSDLFDSMVSKAARGGPGDTFMATRLDEVDDLTRLGGMSPEDFADTGEILLHGTPAQFDVFDSVKAGYRGRGKGGQPKRAGGKFYFTDDPDVASRFAEAGIPEQSLSQVLGDIDLEDLIPADVERLFTGKSTVQVAVDVDDAGRLIYESVPTPEDLVDAVRRSGARYGDEVTVRQLRSDRAPQVIQRKVYGKTLDLTPQNISATIDANPGLREALQADRLIESRDLRIGWEKHQDRFENTASWMREHGYGKAIVPDDPMVSGPTSIIALEDFIDAPGRSVVDDLIGKKAVTVGNNGLDEVDTLAKAFALDGTKNLLYDLGKRSQFFDQLRIVFPFGEAWKEILTSWGKIIYENPQMARRAQQVIHAGRGGDQDPTTGFFHSDPQTGDEVFTYPDFGLSRFLLGTDKAKVSPVGRVAGLNIAAATVLPGFGPAVQLPAQWILPRKPGVSEWLREIVSPFGDQPGETPGQQIAAAFTPAWMEKLHTAFFSTPESNRLFANTVMDVARALHRSGDYPIGSREDVQKLLDDAADKARTLYFIRGIAQSTVPTGPSFTWETADVEGNLVPVKLLSDELRRMTSEEYGGDRNAAFLEWTKRFGVENVLAIQAKSQELVDRPVTEQGDEWLRANQDLERDYPMTVGLFAPEPPAGEFDYSAYLRAFDTGARAGLKPDEMVALANDFLGRVEYEQAKRFAELRPGPQTAAWLAKVREDIALRRPGFDSWTADRVRAQRPQVDQQIAELRDAVLDPRIAQSDAGKGTIKYLSAIEVANRMVASLGGTVRRYNTAKAAFPIRQFLRQTAQEIIAEHPEFARVWTNVFERELADDTDRLLGG